MLTQVGFGLFHKHYVRLERSVMYKHLLGVIMTSFIMSNVVAPVSAIFWHTFTLRFENTLAY